MCEASDVPHPYVVEFLSAIVGLAQKYTIKKIHLNTYTSVDFENQDGMSELYNQTRKILMNDTASTSGLFHKTVAFNVIPQVGSFIGEETEIEWLYNSQIKQVILDRLLRRFGVSGRAFMPMLKLPKI